MLTGNDVFQFLGGIYIGLCVLLIVLVLVFAKGIWKKLFLTVVVLGLFSWWPVSSALKSQRESDAHMAKMKPIYERFDLLCKGAGEKVYRTVEDVDGVFLVNIRPKLSPSDSGNQFWPDAALPHEATDDWYIRMFLFWEQHQDKRTSRGYLNEYESDMPGYHFVDVQKSSNEVFRYKLKQAGSSEITRELNNKEIARYAVSFTNFDSPEDRKYWIAGTKVEIKDTLKNELIAEKIWYSIEPGQGSQAGFRQPWMFARTCPASNNWNSASTRFFVDQVLKPKK